MHHKVLIFSVFWTIFITILSLIRLSNSVATSIQIEHKDKILHFVFYFVFFFTWVSTFKNITKNKVLVIFIVSILYGMVIEVVQSLMPYQRTADWYDIIANCIGSTSSLLIFILISKQNKKVLY